MRKDGHVRTRFQNVADVDEACFDCTERSDRSGLGFLGRTESWNYARLVACFGHISESSAH